MNYPCSNKYIVDRYNQVKYQTSGKGYLVPKVYTPVFEQTVHCGSVSDQNFTTFTASGGTVSSVGYGNTISLSNTTTVGSYATLRSKTPLICRAITSQAWEGTFKFPSEAIGINNSLVFAGMGNAQNDLYFCYQDGVFGVRRSTDGLLEVRTLTITTAAAGAETATITLNGTVYTATLSNAGGITSFTAHEVEDGDDYSDNWNVDHIGSRIVFVANSVGARNGTYSFSSTGTAVGTFDQNTEGQALNTTFYPITSWNQNSDMRNRLDPTKFNDYRIEYSYGIENILFSVFNPYIRQFEVVHIISFANVSDEPNLTSQNMYFQAGVASLGSVTAFTLEICGISMGYYDGTFNIASGYNPAYNLSREKAITGGIETNLYVLENRYELNGLSNVGEIYLARISVAIDGSKPVLLKIIKNPDTISAGTLADYTNYQYMDEFNSPLLYDTTALTYTGGTQITSYVIGINGSLSILPVYPIILERSDTIVISALSSTNNTINISLIAIQDLG